MRKGASRNMQRISLKVVRGTAHPIEGGIKQPPVQKQLAKMQDSRLARIRRGFELEEQIRIKLERGENVAALRETLMGVRNGSIDVPLSLAKNDVPRYRDGTVRQEPSRVQKTPVSRPRTLREMIADLDDIAKGKLTLTGASVVKGMLERFDRDFVDEVLQPSAKFIDKVRASAIFELAPALSAADGLILAQALEGKA